MSESITISKYPGLEPSQDYAWLRQKGMEYIQQLGSKLWTDYNIHDPGITVHELLSYALTDLGHRTAFDIKDLLAVPHNHIPDHRRQGFYTAREILTVNPWTIRDFRKLLIDIDGIKNGWLHVKECACDDIILYANCAKSKLQYEETEHAVIIKGLYDVLVEFEDDERMGNMNSGKVFYHFSFKNADGDYTVALIEMRLPSWQQLQSDIPKYKNFRLPDSAVQSVSVSFISGNKNDNLDVHPDDQASALRRTVYATLTVNYLRDKNDNTSSEGLLMEDVPVRVWFKSDTDRKSLALADLKSAMEDASPSGLLGKYHALVHRADEIMKETHQQLHSHRNLSEDYCTVKAIEVEDIAVCADIEVEPSADIEAVLAEAYYQIDQYFSPDIKFFSLQQLLDEGIPVEDIFEGPALNNGFIKNDQVDSTNLKQLLYTSDIINLLMDIPGITAVKNLSLARYDYEGNQVGASESWEMNVSFQHQPRFYPEASKFLVFKNGLPFLPDKTELNDILQVIKGKNNQPKFSVLENDLQIPTGTFYSLDEYHPIQYQMPLTYGVSYEGLPGTASAERIAQAKQLKAYLLFFEQLLVNYLAQLNHTKDYFAIDPSVSKTYFTKYIGSDTIRDVETEIYQALDPVILQNLAESQEEFLDRRNRFLDHQLARFGETFADYALMLYSLNQEKAVTDQQLIYDKINFLRDIPVMSHDRGKAFNYKEVSSVCDKDSVNEAGLKLRIQRLLGLKEFSGYFQLYEEQDTDGVFYERRWRLVDETGKIQLSSSTRYVDPVLSEADKKAVQEYNVVRKFITDPSHYEIKKVTKWVVNLLDGTGEVIATRKQPFNTKAQAEKARDEIIEFAKKVLEEGKIFIVEHLLFRPRNAPHDHLLTVCIPPDCTHCGEEDPYSFRLTIVLSGESGMINRNIELRHFAEKTIRQEVPAHLGVKICWVSNEQLVEFQEKYCEWLSELAKEEPDKTQLTAKLNAVLEIFSKLKSVYPPATLHDCVDGNDENRVYLNQTIITQKK